MLSKIKIKRNQVISLASLTAAAAAESLAPKKKYGCRTDKKSLDENFENINKISNSHKQSNSGIASQIGDDKTSVYIHWPYCSQICSYCSFNKYLNSKVNMEAMTSAMVTEMETLLRISGVESVSTVYFGGGTPSLADVASLEQILSSIRKNVKIPTNAEINLEVNPTAVETVKLRDFKDIGVNRISVGVQALNNKDLKFLNREHSTEEALQSGINQNVFRTVYEQLQSFLTVHKAEHMVLNGYTVVAIQNHVSGLKRPKCVSVAKEIFPGKVNVDMIFGRPHQTVENVKEELQQVLKICDKHLSLYQLMIEQGTALFKLAKAGRLNMPSEEEKGIFYETAVETLQNAGYKRYEVSNFAQEGAESQHNKSYWQGHQYIGVGPGSHGRFVPLNTGSVIREARVQIPEPNRWMSEVKAKGHGTAKAVQQSKREQLEELLIVSMRTAEGLTENIWQRKCVDINVNSLFKNSQEAQDLLELGLIQLDKEGIRATDKGFPVLDAVMTELLVAMEPAMKALVGD